MATSTTETFKKLPGVLSFQRAYNVSDAEMFNVMPDGSRTPVEVVRHGIRGTQNVSAAAGATAKGGERAVSNIQVTETAKLHPSAVAMEVQFSIRFFDLACSLSACASDHRVLMKGMRTSIDGFIGRSKTAGADAIALRYARNIANGRWLWRNRVVASKITVTVTQGDTVIATLDALAVPTNHFDNASTPEAAIAKVLADGMRGAHGSGLTICARLEFGVTGAIEVFPSQNYVENKPTGFARPLYKIGGSVRPPTDKESGFNVVGHAALRDQKVSNALRTIDTWYALFDEIRRLIPVEPVGANLDLMDFMRNAKNGGNDAFVLFRRLNELDPATPEGQFALACMIRGGVFSESDKPKKSSGDATGEVVEAVAEAD